MNTYWCMSNSNNNNCLFLSSPPWFPAECLQDPPLCHVHSPGNSVHQHLWVSSLWYISTSLMKHGWTNISYNSTDTILCIIRNIWICRPCTICACRLMTSHYSYTINRISCSFSPWRDSYNVLTLVYCIVGSPSSSCSTSHVISTTSSPPTSSPASSYTVERDSHARWVQTPFHVSVFPRILSIT